MLLVLGPLGEATVLGQGSKCSEVRNDLPQTPNGTRRLDHTLVVLGVPSEPVSIFLANKKAVDNFAGPIM